MRPIVSQRSSDTLGEKKEGFCGTYTFSHMEKKVAPPKRNRQHLKLVPGEEIKSILLLCAIEYYRKHRLEL